MWIKNIFILFFVSFLINDFAIAQQVTAKTDSTKIYKNIENYSSQSKLKTFVYRLIFKKTATASSKPKVIATKYKKLIQKQYSGFEGKTIRNIEIVTLDPFGYSATDTTVAVRNFLYRTGNALHIKSHITTIRNLLLIHKNDPFNSLLVKESERLIRSQKYVHEVYFQVVAAAQKSDSVDIFIRELDKWSIIPAGSISTSRINLSLSDENFFGSGHESQNIFSRNLKDGNNSFNTNYFIPNIRNTYINATVHFGFDGYKNFTRSLAVDRPFFSPLAKWAAGVSVASQFRKDTLKDINLAYDTIHLRFKTQDFWAGKAVRIFKDISDEELVTNLIFTLRYLRIRYSEKPTEQNDPLHIYSNEDFYLGGIGISARKYVQDKYIFKYGVIEDVPVGKVYNLTGGYQLINNSRRFYLGMRFSYGNYYKWGYVGSNLEYGTFFHASHTEQGVFTAGVNYSTGLFEIGRWTFRQFVKPQITIGMNRFPYDSITINEGYGLEGFKSPVLSGTKRLLFTLQTQSYAPWNLIGFRFGPYFICSLGILADEAKGLKNSKVYSQIGLGVLIKNENLVFNTFQISISFYPLIPGIGQNVFKMNSYKTTDFGFRDFEIEKPAAVIFR